ncbi:hypothetical protein P7C70_g8361, partial [Phenoliferia sp. Uapishka_3]
MPAFSIWSLLPALSLPTLESLPTFPSFPQSIQRRLLSYLITKAVGPFLKGGLDPKVVESDLKNGRIRIGQLELEEKAINPLLTSLPGLTFSHGTLGSIAANVSWPLSFSSAVDINLDDIELVFRLEPSIPQSSPTTSFESRPNLPSGSSSSSIPTSDDLSDSILSISVAESFVREELHHGPDPADDSISDLGLPGGFWNTNPGAGGSSEDAVTGEKKEEEVTMVAGLIERLLARLGVKVNRVRLRILLEDGAEFELSLDGIEYSQGTIGEKGEAIRSVIVTNFEVFSTLRLPSPSRHSSPTSSHPSSSDEESTEDEETSSEDLSPEQEMYMSQSIADLRDSTASISSSATGGDGGLSMYASAHGGLSAISEASISSPGESTDDETSPFMDPDPSPPTSSPPPQTPASKWRRVSPLPPSPLQDLPPSPSPPRALTPPTLSPSGMQRRRLISLGPMPLQITLSTTRSSLSVSSFHVGPLLIIIDPLSLQKLLGLSTFLPTQPPSLENPPQPSSKPNFKLSLDINLQSLSLILLTSPVSAPIPDSHWTQLHPPSLPPHLRLRLEDVSYKKDSKASSEIISIRDICLMD